MPPLRVRRSQYSARAFCPGQEACPQLVDEQVELRWRRLTSSPRQSTAAAQGRVVVDGPCHPKARVCASGGSGWRRRRSAASRSTGAWRVSRWGRALTAAQKGSQTERSSAKLW